MGNKMSIDKQNTNQEDLIQSDIDYNYASMQEFPSEEYETWKASGRSYNNGHGGGRGEPMPKIHVIFIV